MSKPRLLVVNHNFLPDRGGGAAVVGDLCYSLATRGFDVTVRSSYPYYPEWRDKSGRNGLSIWRYEEQGIKVERYGLFIPSNPNSLWQRMLYELSFFLSLLRSLHRGYQFDVVMAYCPTVSCVAFAAINKLIYRKPLWLNVQDLAAEAAAATGLVRWRWLGSMLRNIQSWFFNRADVWSTISPVMAERLAPMQQRAQPLLVLPNWINESLRAEIEQARTKQPPRSLNQPMRLLYAGNIGRKQNLLELMKALQATDASFEFMVNGSGAQADNVVQWIRETGDTRFRSGPFLDEAGFAEALLWTNFFVITEGANSGASFMPSKLMPGLCAATPVLTVCDAEGPLGSEVLAHQLGPNYAWSDLPRLLTEIATLASDETRYRFWVENARRRSKDYDRDVIVDQYANNLRALLA